MITAAIITVLVLMLGARLAPPSKQVSLVCAAAAIAGLVVPLLVCLRPEPAIRLTGIIPFAELSIGLGLALAIWHGSLRERPNLFAEVLPSFTLLQVAVAFYSLASPHHVPGALGFDLWLPVHLLAAAATTSVFAIVVALQARRSQDFTRDILNVLVAGISLFLLGSRWAPQAGFQLPLRSVNSWPETVRMAVELVQSRTGQPLDTTTEPFHLIDPWLTPAFTTLLAFSIVSLLARRGRARLYLDAGHWVILAAVLGFLVIRSHPVILSLGDSALDGFATAMTMAAQESHAVRGQSWLYPSGPWSLWTPATLSAAGLLCGIWLAKSASLFSRSTPSDESPGPDNMAAEWIPTLGTLLAFTAVSGAIWALKAWGRIFAFDPVETSTVALLSMFVALTIAPRRFWGHVLILAAAIFVIQWWMLGDLFPTLHRFGLN